MVTTRPGLPGSPSLAPVPAPEAIVRPWYGLGIELGWVANNQKHDSRYRDGSGVVTATSGSEYTQLGPTAAVIGMFGLEWSPSKHFAIHAQYGQGVSYRHLRTESTDYYQSSSVDEHNTREGSNDEWSTYPASARAGVSVFY